MKTKSLAKSQNVITKERSSDTLGDIRKKHRKQQENPEKNKRTKGKERSRSVCTLRTRCR